MVHRCRTKDDCLIWLIFTASIEYLTVILQRLSLAKVLAELPQCKRQHKEKGERCLGKAVPLPWPHVRSHQSLLLTVEDPDPHPDPARIHRAHSKNDGVNPGVS